MSLRDYDPCRVFPRLDLRLCQSDELLHLISLSFRMMKTVQGCLKHEHYQFITHFFSCTDAPFVLPVPPRAIARRHRELPCLALLSSHESHQNWLNLRPAKSMNLIRKTNWPARSVSFTLPTTTEEFLIHEPFLLPPRKTKIMLTRMAYFFFVLNYSLF